MPSENTNLVEINVDYWKTWVHQRLTQPLDKPGAMTLFQAPRELHTAMTKHLAAEVKSEEWLVSIVLNRASSFLRQRCRREHLLSKRVPITLNANALDAFIDQDWFRGSMDRLPETQRLCLTLCYGERLSLRQVAGQLEIAPSTVGRHLARALETLRGPIV